MLLIDTEIKNIEEENQEIGNIKAADPSLEDQLTYTWLQALYGKYNALRHQYAIFWTQRARIQWVNKEDQNICIFHNVAHTRN